MVEFLKIKFGTRCLGSFENSMILHWSMKIYESIIFGNGFDWVLKLYLPVIDVLEVLVENKRWWCFRILK